VLLACWNCSSAADACLLACPLAHLASKIGGAVVLAAQWRQKEQALNGRMAVFRCIPAAAAEASEEFQDASALWLSRPSQGSSAGTRFFSMAESEFEDAASELLEGRWWAAGAGAEAEAGFGRRASCSFLVCAA